jgi:hypothetical protein
VGIDIIGDKMTEINVTSPTGLREVKRFGGADIASLFWDAVEAKRGLSRISSLWPVSAPDQRPAQCRQCGPKCRCFF